MYAHSPAAPFLRLACVHTHLLLSCHVPRAGVVCGAAASGNYVWNNPEDIGQLLLCCMMSGPFLTGYTQVGGLGRREPLGHFLSCVPGALLVRVVTQGCLPSCCLTAAPQFFPCSPCCIRPSPCVPLAGCTLLDVCLLYHHNHTQTINDYYDREIDAINEPYRPIPSGGWQSVNGVCGVCVETANSLFCCTPPALLSSIPWFVLTLLLLVHCCCLLLSLLHTHSLTQARSASRRL